ncbi:type II toxin-antitoxin system PemK/MazF family toxin [Nonomuraea sp. NPDC005501]|uniref:type II toxin-antitoxin system PemK/MazF family toxin n=1 Tax=Nonomuraea sp. NPDC005501 TaxID=3156884 RepID=UPI0033B5F6D3
MTSTGRLGKRDEPLKAPRHPPPASYAAIPVKIIVPLTTTERGWDNHIPIGCDGTGLEKPSWAMAEQVRSVSPLRFTKRIGIVSGDVLHEVTGWIADML